LGAKYAVSQVWKLTKQDYKYYIIGVGFTMLGALESLDGVIGTDGKGKMMAT
jgi:hypothetical protein